MPIGMRAVALCKETNVRRIKEHRVTHRVTNDLVSELRAVIGTLFYMGHAAIRSTAFVFVVAAAIVAVDSSSIAARAAPLSDGEFRVLAARCAPSVSATTLEAVAWTESGFDPLALHDDTTGRKEEGVSPGFALVEARQWLARGDSVDIGLMQINSGNFSALDLTVSAALDPCVSLAAGAAVLRAAYGGGDTPAEQQVSLLLALSRYNTGTPFAGIMNGYARMVVGNAGKEALPVSGSDGQVTPIADPNTPPAWDIAEAGAYAEQHGATWLIDLAPTAASFASFATSTSR
jgi:type IV secretion system protein VirB1